MRTQAERRTEPASPRHRIPARQVGLLALQRSAGNRATTALVHAQRQLATPLAPGGGLGGVTDRDRSRAAQPGASSGGEQAATAGEYQGPTISQGPIGEVLLRLPNWDFIPAKQISKRLLNKAAELHLLTVPIPELGVRLDVLGAAEATADFTGGYDGGLRNIQVGISRAQLFSHLADPLFLFVSDTLAGYASYWREFRALADLEVNGRLGLHLHMGASLNAVATALGLFEVAKLGAGFGADASADAQLQFRDRVGIYAENGRFEFRDHKSAQLRFNLAFDLNAYLEAGLLGYTWRKPWNLAHLDIGRQWNIGADLNVDFHSDGAKVSQVDINEETLQLVDLVRRVLNLATDPASLAPATGGGGPGGGGPGGGTPAAPTGRQNDPIPILWNKPPGLYPISLPLGTAGQYFLTEPAWLPVPDRHSLADVRRDASTDDAGNPAIKIGVSPGSRFYPRISSVWPRVAAGSLRGGVKQDQFRRLLAAHGYSWGSHEADHVRDLQWAGSDAYNNLWPLERSHNNAANQVLNQTVSYTDRSGALHTVPLHATPLNLYFRITGYA